MRAAWLRSWRADVALRVVGVVLGCVAHAAFGRLLALPAPARAVGAGAYALAALGFLSASAACALAIFGKHLFDQIEVSARWRPRGD
ncbi:hypothetical protein ACT009_13835 [Sphingomonas sp. Tas61C01]|uniref:hypothetical protein n=1 Tax=Sphingomonas sp. Tas61C01 TaxID=3458297 RepID=UPI00403EB68D